MNKRAFFFSLAFIAFCCLLLPLNTFAQEDCKVELGDCAVDSKGLDFEAGCIADDVLYIPADMKCLQEKGILEKAVACAMQNADCKKDKIMFIVDANFEIIRQKSTGTTKAAKSGIEFLTEEEKESTPEIAYLKEFEGVEDCKIVCTPSDDEEPIMWVVPYTPPTDATTDRSSIPHPPNGDDELIPFICIDQDCDGKDNQVTHWTIRPGEKDGKSGMYIETYDEYARVICYTPELGLRVLPKGKLTEKNQEMAMWHVKIAGIHTKDDDQREIEYRITPVAYPRHFVVAIMDTGELVVQKEPEEMTDAEEDEDDATRSSEEAVDEVKTAMTFRVGGCNTDDKDDAPSGTDKN